MDTDALGSLLDDVTDGSNAKVLLQSVRDIVYAGHGEAWWDSPYRIDDFELTTRGLNLVVTDRALKRQFRYSKKFSEVTVFQKPRRAA